MSKEPQSDLETEQLRQRNRELAILKSIAEALNHEVDLTRALHTVLDQVSELFDLTDHPKVRLGTQYGGESISQDWMVVNNHYLNLLDQN